jgi:hypothetical protein
VFARRMSVHALPVFALIQHQRMYSPSRTHVRCNELHQVSVRALRWVGAPSLLPALPYPYCTGTFVQQQYSFHDQVGPKRRARIASSI